MERAFAFGVRPADLARVLQQWRRGDSTLAVQRAAVQRAAERGRPADRPTKPR